MKLCSIPNCKEEGLYKCTNLHYGLYCGFHVYKELHFDCFGMGIELTVCEECNDKEEIVV